MKFKLINAWVTYTVSSNDDAIFHASLVVHQCREDAVEHICIAGDHYAPSYDYDGDEIIGASVSSNDETFHAALIPANSKYNRNVV